MTSNAATTYTWDGNLLIGQTDGTTTLTFSYDANGNVVSMFNGVNRFYYQRNGQNDIVGILNSSGTQVVAYTYDTWGKLISVTGSLAGTIGAQNPFRYRGYYYDNETGFYYLHSRYYDPTTGRFISPDVLVSTGQGILGHNMYAYCLNNPVNMRDESGLLGVRLTHGNIECIDHFRAGITYRQSYYLPPHQSYNFWKETPFGRVISSTVTSGIEGGAIGTGAGYIMGKLGIPFSSGLSVPVCTLVGAVGGAIYGIVGGLYYGIKEEINREEIE